MVSSFLFKDERHLPKGTPTLRVVGTHQEMKPFGKVQKGRQEASGVDGEGFTFCLHADVSSLSSWAAAL